MRARRPLIDRILEKIDRNGPVPLHRPDLGPCWIWKGAVDGAGYGMVWVDAKQRAGRVHRLVYEHFKGPIAPEMTLDHLCRNKGCPNPEHVEQCTSGENAKRAPNAPYWQKARQTHCKRGHLFDARNTRIHHGRRECRACDRERHRKPAAQTCPEAGSFRKPKTKSTPP